MWPVFAGYAATERSAGLVFLLSLMFFCQVSCSAVRLYPFGLLRFRGSLFYKLSEVLVLVEAHLELEEMGPVLEVVAPHLVDLLVCQQTGGVLRT